MTRILFVTAALIASAVTSPLAAGETPEIKEQAKEPQETDQADSDSLLGEKIAKLHVVHRNLAFSAYAGFLVSDISGIAAAVMLHRDKTDSTGYDVLRYGHWAIGSLSILTYIPQTITAWRMMAMKQKLGMKVNRAHKITSMLTTLGVIFEIAGIAALAVMGAKDSEHFETMSSVHCAVSTLLVMVPFTISAVNSRPRDD